ncbi:integrase domain protein SAM domain protein (plasmid) [Leptolyngbya sp. NIES-3755]|nr:integrase domain protein SAM domain protein [Leptolyngbya sp. NIES-3755]
MTANSNPLIRIVATHSEVRSPNTEIHRSHAQVQSSRGDILDLRLERIKEFLQASNFAPNSQKAYRIELERFVAWSSKAWIDVTPREIAQFKRYLMEDCTTRRGKPLSAAAINQALTALKSFYRWFQLAGYMDITAVLPTAAVKFQKLGKPLPRHFSKEQMQAISVAIAQELSGTEEVNWRDRALLAVLTHGLRAEDVVRLNVGNYNFGNYDGTRLRFVRKKDGEETIVPIREAARVQIQAYLEYRQAQREVLEDESPMFLSYDFHNRGKRLGYQGVYYFAKIRLGEAAGIENLTPHRFRHTYASELVELGIDSLLARTLTGHRSEKVFERYIQGKRLAAAESAFYQAIHETAPDSEQQHPEN